MKRALFIPLFLFCLAKLSGQPGNTELMNAINKAGSNFEQLDHRLDVIEKKIDDVHWYNKVGDIAYIDKVYITGPPLAKETNPTGQGAGNPVKILELIFLFRKMPILSKKYPLLVFPHGGVHANFDTYYTHIVREMVSQGYIVTAAEYRGSTGYGCSHVQQDRLWRS